MVPTACRPPHPATTAPRTRGDGPVRIISAAPPGPCSPHPRGWSQRAVLDVGNRPLLPAPAGMVPASGSRCPGGPPAPRTRGDGPTTTATPHTQLEPAPRTRGDGPSGSTPPISANRCSPHPRGWSQLFTGQDRHLELLPAPAGMVPGVDPGRDAPGSAPRTRGDGPEGEREAVRTAHCSPHPRGWSLIALGVVLRVVLLPAPAGMVPREDLPRDGALPAPRTRGDGPTAGTVVGAACGCSPHPRGWSRLLRQAETDHRLLPAPAGIVPGRVRGRALTLAAPRTRGDGPETDDVKEARKDCSPHPRGWSQHGRPGHRRESLLPAPAGMVPDRRWSR